jgi:HAMP domain-containing protein
LHKLIATLLSDRCPCRDEGVMKVQARSVRFRIVVAFGLCVALMVTIGAFGIFGISRLNSNVKESYIRNLVPVSDLSEVRASEYELRLQIARLQIFRDPGERKTAIGEIRTAQERTGRAWRHYYPGRITGDKEYEIATRIANLLPQFGAATDDVISAQDKGDTSASIQAIRKLIPVGNALNDALDQDAALNLVRAAQFVDDSEFTFRTILSIAIAFVVVGIVIAVAVSTYLVRAISRPLNTALEVANHIADGKLENEIEADTRDEFGVLLGTLKKMDWRLGRTVREIKANSESVALASQEIMRQRRPIGPHGATGGVSRADCSEHGTVSADGQKER